MTPSALPASRSSCDTEKASANGPTATNTKAISVSMSCGAGAGSNGRQRLTCTRGSSRAPSGSVKACFGSGMALCTAATGTTRSRTAWVCTCWQTARFPAIIAAQSSELTSRQAADIAASGAKAINAVLAGIPPWSAYRSASSTAVSSAEPWRALVSRAWCYQPGCHHLCPPQQLPRRRPCRLRSLRHRCVRSRQLWRS